MNPIYQYHFTIPASEDRNPQPLVQYLKNISKKWAFQLESGENGGYLHWQGKMSLKTKKRLNNVPKFVEAMHLSPDANPNNWDYVMKEETRVDGPWMSWEDNYIPRDVREIELFPWQNAVVNAPYHPRKIYVVYDPDGNTGKTTIIRWMCTRRLAQLIPPLNDYKDIMQIVMSARASPCYLIDMPRSLPKNKLQPFWSAIESIKSGHAFDIRYKYKERFFDPPQVWVFTNSMPQRCWLTPDRWQIMMVENGCFINIGFDDAPGNTQELEEEDSQAAQALDRMNEAYREGDILQYEHAMVDVPFTQETTYEQWLAQQRSQ